MLAGFGRMRLKTGSLIRFVFVVLLVCLIGFPYFVSYSFVSAESKIQHVVFIVQENHSFDNYFGRYPGANGFSLSTIIPLDPNQTSLGYVHPFHLNVTQPVLIWGDELPPGVADPEGLQSAESVAPFHLGNESIGGDLPHVGSCAYSL